MRARGSVSFTARELRKERWALAHQFRSMSHINKKVNVLQQWLCLQTTHLFTSLYVQVK